MRRCSKASAQPRPEVVWSWAAGAAGRLQRSKNSANESCVAAPASVADITSPVTFRAGPAGTCELAALCGNCGLDTKPEDVAPLGLPCGGQWPAQGDGELGTSL